MLGCGLVLLMSELLLPLMSGLFLPLIKALIENDDDEDTITGLRLQESIARKYTSEFMKLVRGEQGYPVGFFDIDKVCKKVKIKSASTEDVFNAVNAKGFRITHTHYGPRTIKTDAPISELKEIFEEIG
jgi:tRNA (guanine26-N2/guanine27-N2)-dimethyltransferase